MATRKKPSFSTRLESSSITPSTMPYAAVTPMAGAPRTVMSEMAAAVCATVAHFTQVSCWGRTR